MMKKSSLNTFSKTASAILTKKAMQQLKGGNNCGGSSGQSSPPRWKDDD